MEYDELHIFLRLNEDYDASGDRPVAEQKVIGVPGAQSPAQMTPEHHKPRIFSDSESPLRSKEKPVNKRDDEFDVSTELSGFGLQGVMVSEDDLAKLVADLGLEGDEAGDLVKGLSGGLSPGNDASQKAAPLENDPENPFDTAPLAPPAKEHPDIIPPTKRDEVLVDSKEIQEPKPPISREEEVLKDNLSKDQHVKIAQPLNEPESKELVSEAHPKAEDAVLQTTPDSKEVITSSEIAE